MRADPSSRLPRRTRTGRDLLRQAGAVWALAGRSWRDARLLHLGVYLGWMALSFVCSRVIVHANAALGAGRRFADMTAGELIALVLSDLVILFSPAILGGILAPPVHRRLLHAAWPGQWAAVLAGLRVFAALAAFIGSALLMAAALAFALLSLLPAVGPISTRLSGVLLGLPVLAALLAAWRLSFGLPALSLGLADPIAEAWDISRNHAASSLLVWTLTGLPALAIVLVAMARYLDPLAWPSLLLGPALEIVFVSLTASLTGLLYRTYRLPGAVRPHLRPSRDAARRREPVFP